MTPTRIASSAAASGVDAALGAFDETDEGLDVLVGGIELLLQSLQRLGDVEAGAEEHPVGTLEQPPAVGVEAAPLESDRVDAEELQRVPARLDERDHVLGHAAGAA